MTTHKEALTLLVEALNELLESFEKDGKFCKSSSIRNELYDHLKQILEESKEALAQPEHGWTFERIAGIARLKEAQDKKLAQQEQRNDRTSVDSEQQKPVAHIPLKALEQVRPPMLVLNNVPIYGYSAEGTVAVYTTPPQRKPLTDEQIEKLLDKVIADKKTKDQIGDFARAIEAAHGIKE